MRQLSQSHHHLGGARKYPYLRPTFTGFSILSLLAKIKTHISTKELNPEQKQWEKIILRSGNNELSFTSIIQLLAVQNKGNKL
jgi:hypothetical protein